MLQVAGQIANDHPPSMLLIVAVDSHRASVIRRSEQILGFTKRAGVCVTWAIHGRPPRSAVKAMLSSPAGYAIALWGDAGWTDRSVSQQLFENELYCSCQHLRDSGLPPSGLVTEGTAFHASTAALCRCALTTVVHTANGSNRRTESTRGLGLGVVELPLTHTVARSTYSRWRDPARQLSWAIQQHRDTRWFLSLRQIADHPRLLKQSRRLIQYAGEMQRRGYLRINGLGASEHKTVQIAA